LWSRQPTAVQRAPRVSPKHEQRSPAKRRRYPTFISRGAVQLVASLEVGVLEPWLLQRGARPTRPFQALVENTKKKKSTRRGAKVKLQCHGSGTRRILRALLRLRHALQRPNRFLRWTKHHTVSIVALSCLAGGFGSGAMRLRCHTISPCS